MAALPVPPEDIQRAVSLCATDLGGLGHDFLKTFHSQERDFLLLGRALEGFTADANVVMRRSAELAELTSGEAVSGAAATLSAHLEKLGGACDDTRGRSELERLESVRSVGVRLTEHMRDFTRMVKRLTMLGIATRIESARLGDHGLGFTTLADDVEKLAGKIASSSEIILKLSQDLAAQCAQAMTSLTDMDKARQTCSLSAMSLIEADIRALQEVTGASRLAARELDDEARGMTASVSETVFSLQFHDIIRQQLEHVAEATQEARSMALEGPGLQQGGPVADWADLAGWMLDVLDLQRMQLGNARTRFAQAMDSLADGLAGIAGRVGDMAARAQTMAGSQDGQGGVLGRIKQEVHGIVQALREFAQLERRMAEVMGAVGASIRNMSASVSEIEEVGSEIELIALNASVKAAHTGEEGKALGVLASAIQKLSVEARGQTDAIMRLLSSVEQASLEVAGGDEREQTFERAVAELEAEMARLTSLDGHVSGAAESLRLKARELSEDILRAVESLEFKHALLESMALAESRLDDLTQGLHAVLPPQTARSQSPRLRQMLERYTMEAERLVHAEAMGLSGAAADQGGGSDDNVELF